MKAKYEKVLPLPNLSWRYWLYELEEIPFNWHYHPEYEICLTINSRGQRYVGDHIGAYDDFDLVLVGANLPHTWYSSENIDADQAHKTYVAQLPATWIEAIVFHWPEMYEVGELLRKSNRGLLFSKDVARSCADMFVAMKTDCPIARSIKLFEILQLMAQDENVQTLCSSAYNGKLNHDSATDKIDRIIQYIHKNYTNRLKAEQVAKIAHMSTNHFHRFIKQRTDQTFTELVNQLRIGKACNLLIETDLPIVNISDTCGFNNISNFNRRFLQHKHTTPSSFRKLYSTSKQVAAM